MVHNNSASTKAYGFGDIEADTFWQIPSTAVLEELLSNDTLFTDIGSGDITISFDGVTDYDGISSPDHWNALVKYSNNPIDPDTGGLMLTPKFSPTGWHQQYFETEFETSTESSIHEKTWTNEEIGYSSLKFYKIVSDEEVECTDQTDIDANCIRTDLLWMPDHDFSIKSGFIAQKTVPSENLYVWAIGGDLAPEYGGVQAIFAEGGINMTYVDAKTRSGLDGVSSTMMHYSHPILGDGAGTNRIRFVVRHEAGFKHRLQAVFEIFIV